MATATLTAEIPSVRWSLAHRIGFRFIFCYLALYCLNLAEFLNLPPVNWTMKPYDAFWRWLCPWVAIHVFGLSGQRVTYFVTGSGDTTLQYIQNLLFLVIAVAATIVWSALDRRRANYRTMHVWLRLAVRYLLACVLFTYGFMKLVPQQFRPPSLLKLTEPYGEFSPMGVLWNFMGSSLAYTALAGASEVLGGLLLLFRRTTTLGGLVSAGVMGNVVALNFCYDVPVKLFSTNLMLMAIFLATPDAKRLFHLLVLGRETTAPDPMAVRFNSRRLRIAAVVVWALFVTYTLEEAVRGDLEAYNTLYAHPKHPLIYGLYDVESASDASWVKVAMTDQGISIRFRDGRVMGYQMKYDAASATMTGDKRSLKWSQPDPTHVTVEGQLAGTAVSARLQKIDTQKFLLINRGFHWIQEFPFNR